MKHIIVIILLSFCLSSLAQTPAADELIQVHNVASTTEMNSIVNPIEGSFVYNKSDNSMYIRTDTQWVKLAAPVSETIILNANGGSLPTQTNTFFDLPLTSSNLVVNNTDLYNVTGTSEITILKSGNYLISGELSTTNMPSGDTKYILAAFVNNVRVGYLSRGFASLPNTDFWGTTGILMYQLKANDVVKIRYVLNAGGQTLNANFSNIGITKI